MLLFLTTALAQQPGPGPCSSGLGKKDSSKKYFNWLTNVWGNPSKPYIYLGSYTNSHLFEVHIFGCFQPGLALSGSPGYDRVSPVSDPEPGSPQYCDQFCFCPAPEPCWALIADNSPHSAQSGIFGPNHDLIKSSHYWKSGPKIMFKKSID